MAEGRLGACACEERAGGERRRRAEGRDRAVEGAKHAGGRGELGVGSVGVVEGGRELGEAVEEAVDDRELRLLAEAGGVAEHAFELTGEVASDPGGEIGAIDGAEIGARRLRGGQAGGEHAGKEVLVDAFAEG